MSDNGSWRLVHVVIAVLAVLVVILAAILVRRYLL
jgi:anti-sigma-K factor RskA